MLVVFAMLHHVSEQVATEPLLFITSSQAGVSADVIVAEDYIGATEHHRRRDEDNYQHLDEVLSSSIFA